jgi:hypothetical protein
MKRRFNHGEPSPENPVRTLIPIERALPLLGVNFACHFLFGINRFFEKHVWPVFAEHCSCPAQIPAVRVFRLTDVHGHLGKEVLA